MNSLEGLEAEFELRRADECLGCPSVCYRLNAASGSGRLCLNAVAEARHGGKVGHLDVVSLIQSQPGATDSISRAAQEYVQDYV